eukprot:jgi/Botrbrau1/7401/Bobra.0112s0002.1
MNQYINAFEEALFGPEFTDPVKGWRRYADEKSFIDWWLSTEVVKATKKAYHSSSFMHKDREGPLIMGPQWAVLQGFGTCCGYPVTGYLNDGISGPGISGGSAISPNGWIFNICLEPERCKVLESYDPDNGIAPWFVRLWEFLPGLHFLFLVHVFGDLHLEDFRKDPASWKGVSRPPSASCTWWSEFISKPWLYRTPEEQFSATAALINNWLLARLQWLDGAFVQAMDPSRKDGPYLPAYPGQGLSASAPAQALAGR